MYLAPLSPRRSSNPATPRSSPAISPAPMAPLSAAAVGLGLLRSPSGIAPAAALISHRGSSSAGRSSSSGRGGDAGASRHSCQSFSAGSKGLHGRAGTQQQLQQVQQQGVAAGGVRRSSSAPSTPVAASVRGSGLGSGGGAGGSVAGSSHTGRSRSGVSHESMYCQRLAYSQRSTVAPGVRKTDRVARFQQMQQQWQRDR